ncbi:hypothetical protein [Paraburkholderia adhaesiva]|uniref:hypothetical protein n=1 Tax=Paraburkholderia adhaesiva TaxID=2883244 RepID=UPI001F3BB2D4|nr:hypothetical protein [Paraburkholderia adhaesiva]
MTMLRAYDAKAYIGKMALYAGSVFPVAAQWRWHWFQIGLTVAIAVGLFRGWRWARWLALAVFVVACAISAPIRDVRAVPAYVFWLALSLVAYALLFLTPDAKVYFSHTTRPEPAFTLRGVLSTTFLILAVFTAHSIAFAALYKNVGAGTVWGSSAVFLLPALLLSALARWDLQRSAREIAAALLAVTVAVASVQVSVVIAPRGWYPDAMLRAGVLHGLLLTVVLGITGVALTAWDVRARKFAAP